jgi:flagellar biosynthesis/type III secretory pathway chaperone
MNRDARRTLEEFLDHEIEAANLLATTLSAERSALTGGSPEAVRQRAAEKVRLLETLERLDRERSEHCAATGLDAAADAGGIPDRWRALMQLIAGCRAANEVNGYIIRVRQNQIGQLMDVVRGASPALYGPKGKTFAKSLRALAQA